MNKFLYQIYKEINPRNIFYFIFANSFALILMFLAFYVTTVVCQISSEIVVFSIVTFSGLPPLIFIYYFIFFVPKMKYFQLETIDSPRELWIRAFQLNSVHKYEEAIEFCNKAIRLQPDFVEAYQTKGFALSSLGKYGEALNCYQLALEHTEDKMKEADIQVGISYVYSKKGDRTRARSELMKATEFPERLLDELIQRAMLKALEHLSHELLRENQKKKKKN